MSSKSLKRITSTCLGLLALSAVIAPAAFADEYYEKGLQLFQKKQYAASRPYFDKAAENAPWDSNAYYYQALTAQYCRDWKAAKTLWGRVIERFPGTAAAANATAVMKTLDPSYFRQKRTGSASQKFGDLGTPDAAPQAASASAAGDSGANALLAAVQFTAPSQVRVPITRVDNRVMLDAQINNRSLKVEFNSSSSLITPKDAAGLGITNPDRTAVKAGTRVNVPMRVGDIATRSFPLLVDDAERSRIGDDFFRQFSYSLEPSVLVVTKKTGSSSARSNYDVPFRKQGDNMLVEVTVNGRRCTMVFEKDGSEFVVPKKRAREFGLAAEETSSMDMFDVSKQSGPLRGEAGFGEVKTKSVAEAKVSIGPVANQPMQINVDDNAKDAKIGGSVFSGWKFSVDPGANLIRFNK